MTKLLKRFGIKTFLIVDNGIEVLRQHRDAQWDVILMDCHMPEKNGYDTTIAIRKSERGTHQHIPIIAMTANAMVGDREECLRCGMDEYVSKPIAFQELKEALGQWLHFGEPAKNAPADHMASKADPPAFDLSLLRENTEGDEALLKTLLHTLIQQTDKHFKVFASKPPEGNAARWKDIAHSLKGSAGDIGATKLATLCNEAQHYKGTEQELAVFFDQVIAEYTRVKAQLRQAQLLA